MSTAIRVEHLSKRFGAHDAVCDISFHVEQGEIVGLLGPNGAGKTTTIQMLLGLIEPTAGRIEVLGYDLARQRTAVLQQVNFSSAYVSLPPRLTVWENLDVFARLYGVPRHRERIAELLAEFEIAHLRDRPVGTLSSGQMARVSLCKALLNRPRVLFLDEPTASLDPDAALRARERFKAIRARDGLAILYTSHNMAEIEAVCDRVIFIHRGRILAEGSPLEVTRQILGAAVDEPDLEEVFIQVARAGEAIPTTAGARPER
ncbi:MAG TPA: ABC transporter ATP-binding protein [Chloroflexota bacterium]|jgi:ABC-2 type transport system ATP-binding protein|nr:ABC transporter ATP-binding protein [Chloroflexota bacterium]